MIADLRLRISDWRQRITRLLRRAINPQLAIRNPQWLLGRRFLTTRSGDMVEGAADLSPDGPGLAGAGQPGAGWLRIHDRQPCGGVRRGAGSVAQTDPAGRALEAAQQALASGIGTYNVRVAADTYPGVVARVEELASQSAPHGVPVWPAAQLPDRYPDLQPGLQAVATLRREL